MAELIIPLNNIGSQLSGTLANYGETYAFTSYGTKTYSSTSYTGIYPGNCSVHNSNSGAKYSFTIPGSWSNVTMEIAWAQSSERNWDFGVFSTLDGELSTSDNYSTYKGGGGTNVKHSLHVAASASGTWVTGTESYPIDVSSTRSHFVTWKYVKDSSGNQGADSMLVTQIKFTYTDPLKEYILNSVNKTLSSHTIREFYLKGNAHWTGGTEKLLTPVLSYNIDHTYLEITCTNPNPVTVDLLENQNYSFITTSSSTYDYGSWQQWGDWDETSLGPNQSATVVLHFDDNCEIQTFDFYIYLSADGYQDSDEGNVWL